MLEAIRTGERRVVIRHKTRIFGAFASTFFFLLCGYALYLSLTETRLAALRPPDWLTYGGPALFALAAVVKILTCLIPGDTIVVDAEKGSVVFRGRTFPLAEISRVVLERRIPFKGSDVFLNIWFVQQGAKPSRTHHLSFIRLIAEGRQTTPDILASGEALTRIPRTLAEIGLDCQIRDDYADSY